MKLKTLFGYDQDNYTVREEELYDTEVPDEAEFTEGILDIKVVLHGDAPELPFIKITALDSVSDDDLFTIFSKIEELDFREWFEYKKDAPSS